MKILLFGKNGQLDWELNRSLQPLGEIIALGRGEADFSNPESLRDTVRKIKPDLIVNAVAYTAVDKAEEEKLVTLINSDARGVLAEEASGLGALLVHYSTDYVFDGEKDSLYVETDKPNPINAYGKSKLGGERTIQESGCDYLILRISWIYSDRRNNFLLSILKLLRNREELSIVNDQVGAPTNADLIAKMTSNVLSAVVSSRNEGENISGIYHLSTCSCTSWYGFASKIHKLALDSEMVGDIGTKRINPISSEEYGAIAA